MAVLTDLILIKIQVWKSTVKTISNKPETSLSRRLYGEHCDHKNVKVMKKETLTGELAMNCKISSFILSLFDRYEFLKGLQIGNLERFKCRFLVGKCNDWFHPSKDDKKTSVHG